MKMCTCRLEAVPSWYVGTQLASVGSSRVAKWTPMYRGSLRLLSCLFAVVVSRPCPVLLRCSRTRESSTTQQTLVIARPVAPAAFPTGEGGIDAAGLQRMASNKTKKCSGSKENIIHMPLKSLLHPTISGNSSNF